MTSEVDYYELLECERTADDATLKSAYRKLAMKLGQAIYEKEQAAAASPGTEEPKAGNDDVVDAEFSEVDDNKA